MSLPEMLARCGRFTPAAAPAAAQAFAEIGLLAPVAANSSLTFKAFRYLLDRDPWQHHVLPGFSHEWSLPQVKKLIPLARKSHALVRMTDSVVLDREALSSISEHAYFTKYVAKMILRRHRVPDDLRSRFEVLAGPQTTWLSAENQTYAEFSSSREPESRRYAFEEARTNAPSAMRIPLSEFKVTRGRNYRNSPALHLGAVGFGVSRSLRDDVEAWQTFVLLLDEFDGSAADLAIVALRA